MSTQKSSSKLVSIPAKVLDKPCKDSGKLSSLSPEMIAMIVSYGILDTVDVACLTLTCKYIAKAVVAIPASIMRSKHSTSALMLETHQENPTFGSPHDRLLHRLDVGWNRSNTKLCYSCGVFRSLDPLYWAKREDAKGRTKLWRVQGSSESRTKTVRDFIKPWLKDHRAQLSLRNLGNELYNVQIEINEGGHLFLLCPECVPLSLRFKTRRKLRLPDLRGALSYA